MVTSPRTTWTRPPLRVRRVAAAKVGLHHMRCCVARDDARSDDRAHNSVALRKERGGTTRLLPAYTEFGIPADAGSFLGGYVPAVSGQNFGRRGGWTFLDFLSYLSDYRDIPMSFT